MKKTIFKSVFALALFAGVVSCSNEETTTSESQSVPFNEEAFVDAHSDAATRRGGQYGIKPFLFSYNDSYEAAAALKDSAYVLQKFVDQQMIDNPAITDVVMRLNISNGKAFINDITFLDANNSKVLDGVVRNPITDDFEAVPNSWPGFGFWNAVLNGMCPDGYTSIASCNYSDGAEATAACMGTAQANYTFNNAIVGGQINFNLSFGLTGATVCAQTIKP
ncbi:hypothetical protein LRS05_05815 [Flavobacterium sp. J372]|uniref:hypothetical protein n=1 Tax=Flavobacterium sp. J372 TaxID=2898436 RepID=UPI002151ACAB|nr:hypothetical protein [Flavobacterium sp. J372]MCR5861679.1 hypothetical protein [Flavobacterium sp. J372]